MGASDRSISRKAESHSQARMQAGVVRRTGTVWARTVLPSDPT